MVRIMESYVGIKFFFFVFFFNIISFILTQSFPCNYHVLMFFSEPWLTDVREDRRQIQMPDNENGSTESE